MSTIQDTANLAPCQLVKDAGGVYRIRWLSLEAGPLKEAFFDAEIDKAIMLGSGIVETDLDTLTHNSRGRETLYPKLFIFHMSRCGSTLISNMFRANPKNVVLSEPSILIKLLRLAKDADPIYAQELFKAAVRILGTRKSGLEVNYIIKFPSWATILLPLISAAYPDVKKVFLYREPVEVLASNMRDPEQAWIWHPMLTGLDSVTMTEDSTALDNCARALENTCRAFISQYDPRDCRIHDYSQISLALMTSLSCFCEMVFTEAECAYMCEQMRTHSKKRGGIFAHDSDQKRASASPKLVAIARLRLSEVYSRLKDLTASVV